MTNWPSADKWLPQRLPWLLSSSCCCYKGTTQRPGETCGETLRDHSHQSDGGEASGRSFPLLTVSHRLNYWATVYQMPPLKTLQNLHGLGKQTPAEHTDQHVRTRTQGKEQWPHRRLSQMCLGVCEGLHQSKTQFSPQPVPPIRKPA